VLCFLLSALVLSSPAGAYNTMPAISNLAGGVEVHCETPDEWGALPLYGYTAWNGGAPTYIGLSPSVCGLLVALQVDPGFKHQLSGPSLWGLDRFGSEAIAVFVLGHELTHYQERTANELRAECGGLERMPALLKQLGVGERNAERMLDVARNYHDHQDPPYAGSCWVAVGWIGAGSALS
jgi:hypothetical protein